MATKIDGKNPLIEIISSEESMTLKRGRQFMCNDGDWLRMLEGRERKNTNIRNVRYAAGRRHASIACGGVKLITDETKDRCPNGGPRRTRFDGHSNASSPSRAFDYTEYKNGT